MSFRDRSRTFAYSVFHMEAGNRCKDECLPEETNRRIVDIISDVNMAYSEHTIDVDTFEHGYVNKIFKNINMEG